MTRRPLLLAFAPLALVAFAPACTVASGSDGTADDPPRVHQGLVAGESGTESVDYTIDDEGVAYRFGDEAMGPADAIPSADRAGEYGAQGFGLIRKSGSLWPLGHIAYEFGAGFDQAPAHEAMRAWEQRSGFVKFHPRAAGEKHFLRFVVKGSGCVGDSFVGMMDGAQAVHLSTGCGSAAAGVLKHELGHALGLEHEMQRPDRDQYVNIHWGNVQAGFASAFALEKTGYRTYGAYDYASVMHYSSYEFSKNGGVTITKKDGSLIPWTGEISGEDVRTVKNMYALQKCWFEDRMFAEGSCVLNPQGQGTFCQADASWSAPSTCANPAWTFTK